jgi:hypothetical protein
MLSLAVPVVLAGDITDWIDAKRVWAEGTLQALIIVAGLAIILMLLIKTRGSIARMVVVALGIAIVYYLATHISDISGMFGTEFGPAKTSMHRTNGVL